jgi:mono/diheme cytochrome c family protein
MKKVLIFFLAVLVLSAHSALSHEGKALFEDKCIRCHSLERILSKKKTLKAWKRTVMRMSSYTLGNISEDEAEKMAQYLASNSIQRMPLTDGEAEEMKRITNIEDKEMFNFKKVRVKQFIDPKFCKNCHAEIYDMWSGSMHSKAFLNPLWQSATKLFVHKVTTPGEILQMRACIKCHSPLGFRAYLINYPKDDFDKVPELPAQGVFCNWCHNISDIKHIGDARYTVDAGGGEEDPSTMLGPYRDAFSNVHPTKYSALHTRSEFCGLCHNVTHAYNKIPIEATYDEWKNSTYNTGDPETTISCQDCHMRQRPGVPATGKTERPDNPGKASKYGSRRSHVWTHYFVGANAIITKHFGSSTHAEMAVQNLKHAADVEILKNSTYKKNEISTIQVKVINSGAGHYLPTGLTQIRQMWLYVKVTDGNRNLIFQSGGLDERSKIDKNAVLYNTVLGNDKGEPVVNIAKASKILYDYRIPPKDHVIEEYSFEIPSEAVSPLSIEAILKYRSISQPLAQELMGDEAPVMPVINMANDFENFKLQ